MSAPTVFFWLALLGPLLGLAVPKAMAPLLVLAAASVVLLLWREGRLPALPAAPLVLFGGLVAWSLVTLIWSLEPAHGAVTAGKLAAMLSGGLAMAAAGAAIGAGDRRRIGIALCIGVFAALALLGEETLTRGALSGPVRDWLGIEAFQPYLLNAGTTILAVFLWPALIALWTIGGRRACVAGLVVAAAALTTTESATAAVAVGAGVLAAAWGLIGRGAVTLRRALLAGMLVATLGAPAFSLVKAAVGDRPVTTETVSSMLHRVYIWDFAADRIRDKPVLGWGMDSSRAIPGGHAAKPKDDGTLSRTEYMRQRYNSQLLPLHPHNAGLQVWLELGLPGILLFAGGLAWLLHAIGRRGQPAVLTCLCLAQFATTFAIAELAYGIWQSWWIAAMLLGAALTAVLLPPGSEAGEDRV